MGTLIQMLGAPPDCLDQAVKIDGKFRTTDNPCGIYCAKRDFAAWRRLARTRVVEVMARASLTSEGVAKAQTILAEIDATIDPTLFDIGSATHRMATLYRFANCLSTIPAGSDLPDIPKKEETTPEMVKSMGIAAVGLLAGYLVFKALAK